MLKKTIIFFGMLLVLAGCSVDEVIEKGEDVVKKGIEIGEDVAEKGEEAAATVNKATSLLDENIWKIKYSNVYDEDYTFKELIDATTENPIWKNEAGDYVTVNAKVTATVEGYDGLEEIILGFPFSEEGLPLANAGVFTTIDGAIKVNGVAYEVTGAEVISILCEIYDSK